MEFDRRKSVALAAMASAARDKSPKGNLDAPIVPLLNALNAHPSYFTTSSCSGRISILSQPPKDTTEGAKKTKKKAGGGGWVFVSHALADPDAVADLLFSLRSEEESGELVFRFEPLIIAVECRDVDSAQMLVAAAVSCGFRESGITSAQRRVMVAIRCSIRLEVPLGQADQIMVSREYVWYLVEIANQKMEANKKRTDGFFHALQAKIFLGAAIPNITSDKKDRDWVADKGSLSDLEAKQKDVLSKLKLLEIDAVKSHAAADVRERCSSEIAVNSAEDKGADGSCEDSLESLGLPNELEFGLHSKDLANVDPTSELSGTSKCSLPVVMLRINGEPTEKLFLWGQSACTLNCSRQKHIIVFGGFGGMGQHVRRNYSLLLDTQSGLLTEIDAKGPPSPRLGHTSSVVGDDVFIIGGRCGPMQILNEVWVLHTSENRWVSLECTGSMFLPRHRHAASAVGSNIYVFGGLNNEVIYSSMNILNTDTLQWTEVIIQGIWPSARHSHSLVAYGPLLFMFGGYDGEKALGDLYSFDIRTFLWKKEMMSGRAPFPRFSHNMFIYNNYLGIIGGCPVKQQHEVLFLLNLHSNVWIHLTVDSISRDLWVRSSTCVVDDNLVILCGGASCYAFGTKFNQPTKISLHLIDSKFCGAIDKENKYLVQHQKEAGSRLAQCNNPLQTSSTGSNSCIRIDVPANGDEYSKDTKYLVLQVEKKVAKLVKDILKKFGWLDLSRKVQQSQDGIHIHLPTNRNFYDVYKKGPLTSNNAFDEFHQPWTFTEKEFSINEISLPKALGYLLSCGGSLVTDDVTCVRKPLKSPQKIMRESVCSLLSKKGMSSKLLEQLPMRWERLGDIVVLPVTSFKDPVWDSIAVELWPIVAKSLGAQRLARQGRILPTGTRDSTLEILIGDSGWVTHEESGIFYSFDATKCMFSSGNLSEKLRMGRVDCREEVIVDLFAGIGYFVLPFLVKAKAKFVYACEWNPHAIKALQHNIHANFVADRCVVLEGDNRVISPKGVADRVCLGLLPSSESSWVTAVRALRPEGGVLHVHGNVNDSEENRWSEYLVGSIRSIAQSEGLHWDVLILHLERVKWYGPHVRHLVADVRCKQV